MTALINLAIVLSPIGIMALAILVESIANR
jgi:hypothetical protein